MGRHSAPETDEERPEPEPPESPAVSDAVPASSEPAAVVTVPAPVPGGTRGDLELMRSDTGLLLRCAGAPVLLFLIYTSVLFLIGRTDVYLIWLWIPTVLSGMAIGGLLDRAHRLSAERKQPVS